MTTMPHWIISLISYFQHCVFGDSRYKTCRRVHSFQIDRLAELFCLIIQKNMSQRSWLHGKYKANIFLCRTAYCYSCRLKSKIYFNLQMPKYICAASYMPEKTVNEDSNTVPPDFANLYSIMMAGCYVSCIWPLKEEKMLTNIPAVWKHLEVLLWSVQKISLLACESKKYCCFFVTIIPLNFLLGRVVSYSERKIGESIHLLLRLLPGRLNPRVFQSVVTSLENAKVFAYLCY